MAGLTTFNHIVCKAVTTCVVLLLLFCEGAFGHGFMAKPLSRNKLANNRPEGRPNKPPNYCPHCNNLGAGRRTSGLVWPETPQSARGLGLCGDAPVGPASCWTGGNCPEQDHMPGGKFFTEASDGVGGEIQATYTG